MNIKVGSIVQFKISHNRLRPAIVIKVNEDKTINLAVFLDGLNDGMDVNYKISKKSIYASLPSGGSVDYWWVHNVKQGNEVGECKVI